MEFYRIDKRLKSMGWAERFLFGINTIHNLYLLLGIGVCALGLYIEQNFPDLVYMSLDGAQSGFTYGVIMLAISSGFLASSISIPNNSNVGQVGVRVVARLVFWGTCLIFLMDMLSNLYSMYNVGFVMKYHAPQMIGLFGYTLTIYVMLALGWMGTTCAKLCKEIRAEKEGARIE